MRRLAGATAGLVLLLLTMPATAGAKGVLQPSSIPQGGAAWLRWTGPEPVTAVARYRDRVIFLQSAEGEHAALLGADLETVPGRYPLTLLVATSAGELVREEMELEVRRADHPVERLQLPEAMVSPRSAEIVERILQERQQLETIFSGSNDEVLGWAFRRPVADPVSSVFGRRRILNGLPKSPHGGVDFRSPRGTPVLAPAEGKVAFSGELYFTGKTVILDHGAGLYSVFAHLEAIDCRPEQILAEGEILGRVGSSGRSTGPHLHWGVRLRGDRIDPLALVALTGREKI